MQMIIVIGLPCSGKSTFAEKLPSIQFTTLDIGDIVRYLSKKKERVVDETLDVAIIEELRYHLSLAEHMDKDVVVTGVRQLSIFKYLEEYPCQLKQVVYMATERATLLERFEKRASEKDKGLTYGQIIEKERKLGYAEVFRYLFEQCMLPIVFKTETKDHDPISLCQYYMTFRSFDIKPRLR